MEEWEEPLHLGPLRANITHFLPQCNPLHDIFSHHASPSALAAPTVGACTKPRAARTIGSPACPARAPRKDHALPSAPSPAPRPGLTRRPARRIAAAAGALALTALLAGCGSSSSSGTAADPAAAVPASSILYVGAVVRPEGGLKTATLAAGHSLTQKSDPYSRLLLALQTPGSPTLNFGSEVAPWLGPNAGIYVTSLASAGTGRSRSSSRACSAPPSRAAPTRSEPTERRARSSWTRPTPPRPRRS